MSTLLNPAWQRQRHHRWVKAINKNRQFSICLFFVFQQFIRTIFNWQFFFFIWHRVCMRCERVSSSYSNWQRSIWNSNKSIILSHSTILFYADKSTMINPKFGYVSMPLCRHFVVKHSYYGFFANSPTYSSFVHSDCIIQLVSSK